MAQQLKAHTAPVENKPEFSIHNGPLTVAITTAPENLMPSSGLHEHMHLHEHTPH